MDVSNTQKPTAKAEATRKGIRKVNLNEIQGLSRRGRDRFNDPDLAEAFREAMVDGEAFIWESAQVTGDTEKALTTSKAKWRGRAKSVFDSLNATGHTVSIAWTETHQMVLMVKPKG